ncbi:MAG: carbohydrate ABC transporter permease [Armatimonadota bacterium]|nr:carbohydrate ABC transporter permease [Armatimonadota bacterium]
MAIRWYRLARRLPEWGASALLAALMIWILFPYYWMLHTALRPQTELFTTDIRLVPKAIVLDNFARVLREATFTQTFVNALIVSALTAAWTTLICTLLAYSLARYRYGGRDLVVKLLLIVQMLPGVLLVIPLFVVFARLRLINTFTGLTLAFSTFAVPFAGLMLRGFFSSMPVELEEAGMTDGCTKLQTLWFVTLPLSLPGIVAVALFGFVLAWNDFLFALVLTRDTSAMTVAVQLYNYATSQFATDWSLIIAGACLMTVPVVLLFMFLQGYLVEGLTAGGLKG